MPSHFCRVFQSFAMYLFCMSLSRYLTACWRTACSLSFNINYPTANRWLPDYRWLIQPQTQPLTLSKFVNTPLRQHSLRSQAEVVRRESTMELDYRAAIFDKNFWHFRKLIYLVASVCFPSAASLRFGAQLSTARCGWRLCAGSESFCWLELQLAFKRASSKFDAITLLLSTRRLKMPLRLANCSTILCFDSYAMSLMLRFLYCRVL